MIGMGFTEFLVLLVIGVITALIVRALSDISFGVIDQLALIIIGWLGAWLGPPVFGNWFTGVTLEGVYIIPALLGGFAATVLCVHLQEVLS